MSLEFGLSVYFVIWWISIFLVLPWGSQQIGPEDVADGQMPGAPKKPHLLIKVAANTVLAGVFWGIFYYLHTNDIIGINVS